MGRRLIECKTYRHSGHSRADPAKYRPEGELDKWKERDPIFVYRARLREFGIGDDAIAAIDQASMEKVEAATERCKASPPPPAEILTTDVYAGRRLGVAELTYRDAVARGIAQEMERDENVVFLGEDVAKAGGVFKATVGLFDKFGPVRVRDTPISEQAILGAAMGAAMTGLRPIAEIMFSDFLAVCFDFVANEIRQDPLHDQRPGFLPARGAHRKRRRLALRRTAQPVGRELGDDDPRPQGRRARRRRATR